MAEERFNFQTSLMGDLKGQIAALNDALGESPARMSKAALAAQQAGDVLAQRVSTIEDVVSRIEEAFRRLEEKQLPPAPKQTEGEGKE